ncbi:MAG TPA: ABC transporter permease [Acidimicrobiia bacterium]|jgi:peptide/nickel transport system permease protein|nr:ABC transporter permease [Acidimicrobiia bacterium]
MSTIGFEASPELLTEPEGSPDAAARVEVAPNRRLGFGGWFAIIWLALVLIGAVLGTLLPGIHGYRTVFLDDTSTKPFTHGHLLGVDDVGHDEFSNLVLGARTSLEIGLGSVLAGILIGGTLGLIAGYFRGTIDLIISTVFDVLLAVPALILALALTAFLRGDPTKSHLPAEIVLIIALGTVSTPVLGRITRASTLTWSQREFVMAARAQGAKNARIMVREVLPNVIPAMLSIALLAIGVVIVAEGGLSFLGVGVDPTVKPSWGNLIASSASVLNTEPWLVFGPIVALFLTVLSLNFLGDVVQARFNVRESAV